MALNAGTDVSIDSEETVTGSGLKKELYDAMAAKSSLPALVELGQTTPPFSEASPATAEQVASINAQIQPMRVEALRSLADLCNPLAAAIIAHLTTNGEAVLGPGIDIVRTEDELLPIQ